MNNKLLYNSKNKIFDEKLNINNCEKEILEKKLDLQNYKEMKSDFSEFEKLKYDLSNKLFKVGTIVFSISTLFAVISQYIAVNMYDTSMLFSNYAPWFTLDLFVIVSSFCFIPSSRSIANHYIDKKYSRDIELTENRNRDLDNKILKTQQEISDLDCIIDHSNDNINNYVNILLEELDDCEKEEIGNLTKENGRILSLKRDKNA